MTPLVLDIIMHYYARGNDYRDGDFSAPAVAEARGALLAKSIIREATPEENFDGMQEYRLTDRGHAYVEKVLSIEFPVQKWVYDD